MASTAVRGKKKARPLLPSGHPVRSRKGQQLIWQGLAALFGVGFVAGLYWLGLQQDWHNVFGFLPKGTSAKTWWDNGMGFIHSRDWSNGIWRHGLRDKAEPIAWAIAGGILLGSSKSRYIIRLPLLIASFITMFALVVAAALFITWFTFFGPARHLSGQWQNLVGIGVGLLAGQALHRLWIPVANCIRYQLISLSQHRSTAAPLWVILPIAPPGWREMWTDLKNEGVTPAKLKAEAGHKARYIVPLLVLLFLFIAIVGDLAKYGVARGVHIPVMNP